ncbi:MAG: ADP-ribosylglycohydrolase family protein [Planctomycetota bacterium]
MTTAPYHLNQYQHAYGAFLGILIGDAIGARLEFQTNPSAEAVVEALTMPGGGPFQVAPGQFTDDGELTICLARGLIYKPTFSLESIARFYSRWFYSQPFDMGNTTSQAFSAVPQDPPESTSCAALMIRSAQKNNMGSKANGSLMRCVPLGIYGFKLSAEDLHFLACRDSYLSHPNLACSHAVSLYILAVASLIQKPGDSTWALDRVQEQAKKVIPEVQEWLSLASKNVSVPYSPQEGFVKIAFIHAFRHLYQKTSWIEALKETLSGGGDTDTNAGIICGLLGARDGINALPEDYRQKVFKRSLSQGIPRPPFLSPKDLPELVVLLLEKAPERIEKGNTAKAT